MILHAILAMIFILIFDSIWLTLCRPLYEGMVRSVQGQNMRIHRIAAGTAYMFMFISLLCIIFPAIRCETANTNLLVLAAKYAAINGLVIYGIFNATNKAIFVNYPLHVAFLDTMWGTFVYFASVLLTMYILGKPSR